jgi:hypothetical protein
MARRQANRADILTEPIRARLLERFKKLPPDSIGMVRMDPNAESREFADVLEYLLIDAGCFVGSATANNISTNMNPQGRVTAFAYDEKHRPPAKALIDALAEAGIPDVAIAETPPAIGGVRGAPIVLTIKPK